MSTLVYAKGCSRCGDEESATCAGLCGACSDAANGRPVVTSPADAGLRVVRLDGIRVEKTAAWATVSELSASHPDFLALRHYALEARGTILERMRTAIAAVQSQAHTPALFSLTPRDFSEFLEAANIASKYLRPEPDAVDGKFAPSYAVVRADFHDAVALLHHYRSNATQRIDISTQSLPRVVRELAALMTEEQRTEFYRNAPREISARRTEVDPSDEGSPRRYGYVCPRCRIAEPSRNAHVCMAGEKAYRLSVSPHTSESKPQTESGPGIAALPERREPLAFLDEDLLCEDV